MSKEPPSLSWRERCIQEFSLLPLPDEWTANNDDLSNLSRGQPAKMRFPFAMSPWGTAADNDASSKPSALDDVTWKRYHEFRTRLVQEQAKNEKNKDDDYEGYGELLNRCQEAFREELKRLYPEGSCCLDWQSHTIQKIEYCEWEYDSDDLRGATYLSFIFSPYAIPHALKFKHHYYSRAYYRSLDFCCYWLFSMLRFDGEPGGDTVQRKLAWSWPDEWDYRGPTQPVYLVDQEMEYLASNRYIDPPEVEGGEWIRVEDINVSNFTPVTVRRLREWLFGCSFHSLAVMDNFSLLRLLLASCGSAGFGTIKGYVGYTWSPEFRSEEERQLQSIGILRKIDDIDDDDDDDVIFRLELNWLEYQARLVSGALRPQDTFYVPYNILKEKAEWGNNLIERANQNILSGFLHEGEDLEDIRSVAWVLWERAEEKQAFGGIMELMRNMMEVRGKRKR